MISITVKWHVKPEYADSYADLTREFADACRAEPGCLFFDYARDVNDPNVYYVIEGYRDAEAGKAHVESEHFKKAMKTHGKYAARRPQVISVEAPQDDWNELSEIEMAD